MNLVLLNLKIICTNLKKIKQSSRPLEQIVNRILEESLASPSPSVISDVNNISKTYPIGIKKNDILISVKYAKFSISEIELVI